MKNYFRNWNFMRVIRLALGVFIIVQAIQDKQWILAALGGAFALMAVFNIGCIGNSCATPTSRSNKSIEDVTYEEVK